MRGDEQGASYGEAWQVGDGRSSGLYGFADLEGGGASGLTNRYGTGLGDSYDGDGCGDGDTGFSRDNGDGPL